MCCYPWKNGYQRGISVVLFDFESALDRFMGEREILIEVLTPYIESLESNILMLTGLNPGSDCKKIREIAHSIKGSSLNLDIVPLGRAAENLEDLAYNNEIERIGETVLNVKELASQTVNELQNYL